MLHAAAMVKTVGGGLSLEMNDDSALHSIVTDGTYILWAGASSKRRMAAQTSVLPLPLSESGTSAKLVVGNGGYVLHAKQSN
jgi:hypothetical protein